MPDAISSRRWRQMAAVGVILGVLGLICSIAGMVFVVIGHREEVLLGLLEASIPASVADAAASEAGPVVRIRAPLTTDAPAHLPGGGERVVWGKIEIKVPTRRRTGGSTRHSTETTYSRTVVASGVRFDQGGARLPIDDEALEGAEIEAPLHHSVTSVERTWIGPSGRIKYGDLDVSLPMDSSGAPTLDKRLIAPGDEAFVIGRLTRRGGALVLAAPPGARLYIGFESESALRERLASGAAVHGPLGWVLIALGGLTGLGGAVVFFVGLARRA